METTSMFDQKLVNVYLNCCRIQAEENIKKEWQTGIVIQRRTRRCLSTLRLPANKRSSTITALEIQAAVRELLPGERAECAVAEGMAAISKQLGEPVSESG